MDYRCELPATVLHLSDVAGQAPAVEAEEAIVRDADGLGDRPEGFGHAGERAAGQGELRQWKFDRPLLVQLLDGEVRYDFEAHHRLDYLLTGVRQLIFHPVFLPAFSTLSKPHRLLAVEFYLISKRQTLSAGRCQRGTRTVARLSRFRKGVRKSAPVPSGGCEEPSWHY